ncbi:hypothetical protein MRX96_017577 [Rhipicephalus microplus]
MFVALAASYSEGKHHRTEEHPVQKCSDSRLDYSGARLQKDSNIHVVPIPVSLDYSGRWISLAVVSRDPKDISRELSFSAAGTLHLYNVS